MARKSRKSKSTKKAEDYDSDDPKAYKGMATPDPESSEYYHDVVDQFNSNRNKISLDAGLEPAESSSDNEEEVLGLDDSDSDDLQGKMRILKRNKHLEDIASDLEEEGEDGEDEEMPDVRAWGQKAKDFFHTDYVDADMPGREDAGEEAAREEEEREALAIQQRMAETLDEGDFGLDLFKAKPTHKVQEEGEVSDEEQKVTLDLSKLTKREKLQILKKESPEFLELVEDFKVKMNEVIERLQPLHTMVKDGRIPEGPGATYVKTKYQLCLGYCTNISFYMVLKARHTPIHNHPIIGRILQYRKLLSELQPADEKFADEIQSLLENGLSDDEQSDTNDVITSSTKRIGSSLQGSDEEEDEKPKHKLKSRKKRSKKSKTDMTSEEQKGLQYYEAMEKKLRIKQASKDKNLGELAGAQDAMEDEGVLDREEADEKRGISYQISKNKGLTARKRKELRNPRVKHRMKYKKAQVRRKGQVREARTELQRYGGELSGIRAGVVKSTKFK